MYWMEDGYSSIFKDIEEICFEDKNVDKLTWYVGVDNYNLN